MLSYEALMQEVRDTIDQIAQEDLSASMIGFTNSGTEMVSTDVQSAIVELKGDLDNINVEEEISGIIKTQSFNNTISVPRLYK
jgi:septal ring-binding cell division protein DamX